MQVRFFIIIFLIGLSWVAAPAQQHLPGQHISMQADFITLDQAFAIITSEYQIPIAYNAQEASRYVVSAHYTNLPVNQLLSKLVANTQLEVKKVNQVYVIKPKKQPKIELKTISVKTEDLQSGEPLPYAFATVVGSKLMATTNRQGVFSFIDIPDTAHINISYLGYKDTIVQVSRLPAVIGLAPDPSLLKEIVVKDQGSNTLLYGQEPGKITFSPLSIDRLPVMGGNDVFRALQLLPGISGTNETSAGLIVRGNSPDKNLVLLDGYSLYHVDHFYGIYSAFNSKAIKNVQLYKGNFMAKYGGRSASVMILSAKDGNKEKFSGDIGLNFVDINGVFEFALNDKFTLIAAGRRSITDVVENYLFKELFDKAVVNSGDLNNASNLNYKELNPNFVFGDLNIKATYQPNKKDNFAVSFYASNDNLSYEYQSNIEGFVDYTTSERSSWGNLGLSGRWSRQWSKAFHSQAQIAYSSYYSNTQLEDLYQYNDTLNLPDEEYLQAQFNTVNDVTLTIDNELKTTKNGVINFGIANTFNTINLTSIIDEEEFPLFNQEANQFQFYGQYSFFITPKVETNLGLRGNYYNLTDQWFWEPKATLNYDITKWLTLKGAWAINNQMISRILRLDLFTSNPNFWILSNDNTGVINSNQWSAGVHLSFPFASFDIEGYINNSFNEVQYLPTLRNFDVNDQDLTKLYATGSNSAKGIEVLVEKGVGNYSGWIGYTLSNSLNLFDDLNGGKPFPSRYNQRHELKIVNMYNKGSWNFALTWIYGTGKPYSAPEGNYTLTTLDGSKINNVAYSRINNQRLPDYHRLDFSTTYSFKLGKTDAKAGISIFNVYNRKNIKYRRFSKITFDENGNLLKDDRYIVTDVLLLGFTPSVFVNWKF